jgi:hypothetical protein
MTDQKHYTIKRIPKPGDIVYIDSSLRLSHGVDDRVGGKVTVDQVKCEYGQVWITLKEFPVTSCNWGFLEPLQDYFKECFEETWARRDPDLRPEFNQWD